MDYLRKTFKTGDKKNLINLALAFFIGMILIISGGTLFNKSSSSSPPDTVADATEETTYENNEKQASYDTYEQQYQKELEQSLEETLSMVDGAGEVEVMLTLSTGKEVVVANDVTSQYSTTIETDSQGGTRETYETSSSNKNVILQQANGSDQPLTVTEVEPKVQGVIIIAEGGGDPVVQQQLVQATQTVLGIEANKVQVLKMK